MRATFLGRSLAFGVAARARHEQSQPGQKDELSHRGSVAASSAVLMVRELSGETWTSANGFLLPRIFRGALWPRQYERVGSRRVVLFRLNRRLIALLLRQTAVQRELLLEPRDPLRQLPIRFPLLAQLFH